MVTFLKQCRSWRWLPILVKCLICIYYATTANIIWNNSTDWLCKTEASEGLDMLRHLLLTLSGPAFSVVRQSRGGGSEAQMPKIKVNINWLKLNFAWVIISIKAFLMQNLRLIALLVLEIWCHKIFLKRRERVIRFDYLPPENGFNFKKNEFLCPESFFSTQNWPPCQFQQFSSRGKFFIFKIFGMSRWKKSSSNPPDWSILLKFGQNVP